MCAIDAVSRRQWQLGFPTISTLQLDQASRLCGGWRTTLSSGGNGASTRLHYLCSSRILYAYREPDKCLARRRPTSAGFFEAVRVTWHQSTPVVAPTKSV